jgi:hypothetical protein
MNPTHRSPSEAGEPTNDSDTVTNAALGVVAVADDESAIQMASAAAASKLLKRRCPIAPSDGSTAPELRNTAISLEGCFLTSL